MIKPEELFYVFNEHEIKTLFSPAAAERILATLQSIEDKINRAEAHRMERELLKRRKQLCEQEDIFRRTHYGPWQAAEKRKEALELLHDLKNILS